MFNIFIQVLLPVQSFRSNTLSKKNSPDQKWLTRRNVVYAQVVHFQGQSQVCWLLLNYPNLILSKICDIIWNWYRNVFMLFKCACNTAILPYRHQINITNYPRPVLVVKNDHLSWQRDLQNRPQRRGKWHALNIRFIIDQICTALLQI